MTFRSKKDGHFYMMMAIVFIIVIGVFLFPIFFDLDITVLDILACVLTTVIIIGYLLWYTFSIKYVFYDEYLHVKGTFFRKNIFYKDIITITHINSFADTLFGYRLLTSKKGLELIYRKGLVGDSIKISPKDEALFIFRTEKTLL